MKNLFLAALLASFLFLDVARADVDLKKPLDLKFTAVDGRQVDLSKLRGKVVLLDFWATWCPPCRAIAPDIRALYDKYHAQGFEVVGVSVDSDKSALLAFVKQEGAPWPQYFDGKGADNDITSKYDIESFPTLWLVGKDGIVADSDFRRNWVVTYGIPEKTSDTAHQKLDAEIEKQLGAP